MHPETPKVDQGWRNCQSRFCVVRQACHTIGSPSERSSSFTSSPGRFDLLVKSRASRSCFFRMMCLWVQLYRKARLPNLPCCFGCSYEELLDYIDAHCKVESPLKKCALVWLNWEWPLALTLGCTCCMTLFHPGSWSAWTAPVQALSERIPARSFGFKLILVKSPLRVEVAPCSGHHTSSAGGESHSRLPCGVLTDIPLHAHLLQGVLRHGSKGDSRISASLIIFQESSPLAVT